MTKQFKQQTTKSIFFIVTLLMAAGVSVSVAFAQNDTTRVLLQQITNTGDTVTVSVIAENVTNLYGVEFKLKYDPATVSVVDANPDKEGIQIIAGDFLPTGTGFVVINQANPDEGTISFAMTLLNPAPAVDGSGSLAQVTFNVGQNQPSPVDILDAKLVSADLQIIPAQLTGLTIGDEAAPVQSTESSFPWWIVAAGIIIVGFIGIGIFLAKGHFKQSNKSGPPSESSKQSQVQQRPQHKTGSRPSAFK